MTSSAAITNVRVFDGHELGELSTVVIQDGLIAAATSVGGVTEVVDGAGGTLLPGLIDTHVHVDKVAHLESGLAWGVTTMLDMGNRDPATQALLKDLDGLPTLKCAGSPASAPGSVFVRKMGFAVSTSVSGPADAARFVADRVAQRSDYVKILVEDPKIPGTKALAAPTVAALVAAAHDAGLLTIAHVVSADTMRTALRCGVDIATHTALTSELGAEFDDLLAQRPTAIIPTLAMMNGVRERIGRKVLMRALGAVRPSARMNYAHAESTVATFRRAGMVILAGTDANDDLGAPYQLPHGESLHDELSRMVRAGLTPVEALRGATSLAAQTFGLKDRGEIRVGRRADLVLVDGNPTRDISTTRRIRGVWIGGATVKGAG